MHADESLRPHCQQLGRCLIGLCLTGLFCPYAVALQEDADGRSTECVDPEISLSAGLESKSVSVRINGDLFTKYQYGEGRKPFLHPVFGPEQIRMTRNFPMEETKGEASDHPHHRSIWIGHEINGLDFWTGKDGSIEATSPPEIEHESNTLVTNCQWKSNSGTPICSDSVKWSFGADQHSRWIDCEFALIASEGPIEIGDTKEGTVAIRTHPDLRLKPDPKRGVKEVFGSAFNAAGDSDADVWGKPARWIAYTGSVDSKPASILLLDHSDNLRFPTTWHARDYGLIAANPFGLSAFRKMKPGEGKVTLSKDQRITLRYRFVFFAQAVTPEICQAAFEEFTTK